MLSLPARHIMLLYAIEGMLFTRWPYYMAESVYSCTNLIAPVSLLGITCLLCSYARLTMYGIDGIAQRYWEYTTVFRKFAALMYYSSILLVLFVVVCTVVTTCLRRQFRDNQYSLTYSGALLYALDCVFMAYIVVIALLSKSIFSIFIYVLYHFFFHMYAEIRYIFTHFYFLALFPMLSWVVAVSKMDSMWLNYNHFWHKPNKWTPVSPNGHHITWFLRISTHFQSIWNVVFCVY